MTSESEAIERSTRLWVERMVVGLGFCPFAAAVVNKPGALAVEVVNGDTRDRLQWLLDRLHDLQSDLKQNRNQERNKERMQARNQDRQPESDSNPRQNNFVETVLMVMPEGLADFEEFLDFADLAQGLLELHEFAGVFQLATFHPDYRFADSESDDAANYTNRSPYPVLHILREQQVTEVLENFLEPELIPERNIRYARSLGIDDLAERLRNCVEVLH